MIAPSTPTRRGFLSLLAGAFAARFAPAVAVTPAPFKMAALVQPVPQYLDTPIWQGEDKPLTLEHLLKAEQHLRDANIPRFDGSHYHYIASAEEYEAMQGILASLPARCFAFTDPEAEYARGFAGG